MKIYTKTSKGCQKLLLTKVETYRYRLGIRNMWCGCVGRSTLNSIMNIFVHTNLNIHYIPSIIYTGKHCMGHGHPQTSHRSAHVEQVSTYSLCSALIKLYEHLYTSACCSMLDLMEYCMNKHPVDY